MLKTTAHGPGTSQCYVCGEMGFRHWMRHDELEHRHYWCQPEPETLVYRGKDAPTEARFSSTRG